MIPTADGVTTNIDSGPRVEKAKDLFYYAVAKLNVFISEDVIKFQRLTFRLSMTSLETQGIPSKIQNIFSVR